MLAAFLAMTPSMATSDGHSRVEPPPKESLCPHLPHDAGAEDATH